jgi:F-box/WD-40 domain protein MET30
MSPPHPSNSYVCDTLPVPRLAPTEHSTSDSQKTLPFDITESGDDAPANSPSHSDTSDEGTPAPSIPRKLCVRHQRMADEGTNLKLQQVS